MHSAIQIIGIIIGILGIETSFANKAQRMNKLLIAYIYCHMRYMFFFCCSCFSSKEYQISRLKIATIGSDIDMLPDISHLRSVARNNNVVVEQYSTNKATAINSF